MARLDLSAADIGTPISKSERVTVARKHKPLSIKPRGRIPAIKVGKDMIPVCPCGNITRRSRAERAEIMPINPYR